MHLRRVPAVPFIPPDRAGKPPAPIGRRREQRLPKLGCGTPEGDPLERLSIVATAQSPNVAVADDSRPKQADGPGRNPRTWPAGPVRSGKIECIAKRTRNTAGGQQGIQQQGAFSDNLFDVGCEAFIDEVAERIESARR